MIPYGRQDISEEDIAAVVGVMRSDWLTQGPAVAAFERSVATYTGAAHAVAVSSATAGLHLAVRALDLGAGGLLWTVPNTFVATANVALYCGAKVDFVDTDPQSYCMSVEALEAKLKHARQHRLQLPSIVVPVHFAGQSCDMRAIHALSLSYGFRIIEDASHAIGADYLDGKAGDCRFSDMAVFSFHPVKIITTGEGGIVTTQDAGLALRLSELRSHGVTRDPARMEKADQGGWYYELRELGLNYRMTDMQAALGQSQLSRVDAFVGRRRELAARYDLAFQDEALTRPWQSRDGASSFHLYPIHVDPAIRRRVFDGLRQAGIGVNVHYIPVHLQPLYAAQGFKQGYCPNAEHYYAGAISLPMFSRMSDSEHEIVVDRVRNVLGAAR